MAAADSEPGHGHFRVHVLFHAAVLRLLVSTGAPPHPPSTPDFNLLLPQSSAAFASATPTNVTCRSDHGSLLLWIFRIHASVGILPNPGAVHVYDIFVRHDPADLRRQTRPPQQNRQCPRGSGPRLPRGAMNERGASPRTDALFLKTPIQ